MAQAKLVVTFRLDCLSKVVPTITNPGAFQGGQLILNLAVIKFKEDMFTPIPSIVKLMTFNALTLENFLFCKTSSFYAENIPHLLFYCFNKHYNGCAK